MIFVHVCVCVYTLRDLYENDVDDENFVTFAVSNYYVVIINNDHSSSSSSSDSREGGRVSVDPLRQSPVSPCSASADNGSTPSQGAGSYGSLAPGLFRAGAARRRVVLTS